MPSLRGIFGTEAISNEIATTSSMSRDDFVGWPGFPPRFAALAMTIFYRQFWGGKIP
jgi:hypothetical protein